MPYPAVVLNVMFACPSDVVGERQAVREVIDDWNGLHAESERCVLAATDWLSHSSPAMGERPQAIINRQVLHNADLLVAVFWTRIGSPTGVAESGTIEEIEEHIEAGKPTLIYFSSTPADPNRIDGDQLAAFRAFREKCQSRGLVSNYASLTEFKDMLNRHLTRTVRSLLNTSDEVVALQEALAGNAVEEPSLSDDAQALLLAIANDQHGYVIASETLGGFQIQVGGLTFGERGNRRSEAHWKAVIDELFNLGLLAGHRPGVAQLTEDGFKAADVLPGRSAK